MHTRVHTHVYAHICTQTHFEIRFFNKANYNHIKFKLMYFLKSLKMNMSFRVQENGENGLNDGKTSIAPQRLKYYNHFHN